ncbi:hypothetical protein BB558_004131 [Smittium angustum]|uniref:Transcription initiation factor TFIID subunit 1 histone acetyltransferase domain-containing protein n=1 Tax=Smittium angustum TaxID=133377 RepID=A0A2U1J469_SMIAN|nr:hypothetical protein BB558_004131 [Smittium angustum]
MSLNFLFGNVDDKGQLDLDDIDNDFKETLAEVGMDQENASFLEAALGGAIFSNDQGIQESGTEEDSDSTQTKSKKIKTRNESPESENSLINQNQFSFLSSPNEFGTGQNFKSSSAIIAEPDAVDYSNIDEVIYESSEDEFIYIKQNEAREKLTETIRKEISDYDSSSKSEAQTSSESESESKAYLSGDERSQRVQKSGTDIGEDSDSFIETESLFTEAFGTSDRREAERLREISLKKARIMEMISSNKIPRFTDIFGGTIKKKMIWHSKFKPVSIENLENSKGTEHQFQKGIHVKNSKSSRSKINGMDFKKISEISIKDNHNLALSFGLVPENDSPEAPNQKVEEVTQNLDFFDSNHKLITVPHGLEIENWEDKIIWDLGNVNRNNYLMGAGKLLLADRNATIKPINTFLENSNWENDIVWDLSKPAKRIVVKANINDPLMLIDINEQKSHAMAMENLEKEKMMMETGLDKLNISNDLFYEALQEGKVQRVRQTFGQLIVRHSVPSVHLQTTLFKTRFSRADLRNWHKPKLIVFPKSSNNELKKYSEEYPPIMSNVGMGSVLVNYYRKEDERDNFIPDVKLGDLFVLGIADASPFLNFGNVNPGQMIPILHNNLFRAPLFCHSDNIKSTDFLGIKYSDSKWYIRSIPHFFVAGQTYPVLEVPTPHSRRVTTIIKHKLHIAAYRLINSNPYNLLNLNRLSKMFPEYNDFQLRQRLKEFCEYQRRGLGSGYWRAKPNIPVPSEEQLRNMLSPEMMCLFESMLVSQQQLIDSGCPKSVVNAAAPSALAPLNLSSKSGEQQNLIDSGEFGGDDTGASLDSQQIGLSEEKFATWNTTRNFISATQGKAMLQLCGEGDCTGIGSGFSFLRVSMKDIFLRAGESISEKLAEIEARPKSAHRYNVAEQQEIYREEIMNIWNSQFNELSETKFIPSPDTLKQHPEAYKDELLIVPNSGDYYLPIKIPNSQEDSNLNSTNNNLNFVSENGNENNLQNVKDITDFGSGSGEIVKSSGVDATTNEFFKIEQLKTAYEKKLVDKNLQSAKPISLQKSSFPGRLSTEIHNKQLVIKRVVRSKTGELVTKTETIKDTSVIELYLRQKLIMELKKEKIRIGDLKKARKVRMEDLKRFEKTHMSTFSLPPPNKPRKEVVRKCGNCGQLGHMKTNKKCPRYFEFNAV